jgi:hypothetical protein
MRRCCFILDVLGADIEKDVKPPSHHFVFMMIQDD